MNIQVPSAVHRIILKDIFSPFSLFGRCHLPSSSPLHKNESVLFDPIYLVQPLSDYNVLESAAMYSSLPSHERETTTAVTWNATTTTMGVAAAAEEKPSDIVSPYFSVLESAEEETKTTNCVALGTETLIYDVMRTCETKILFKGPHMKRIYSGLRLALNDHALHTSSQLTDKTECFPSCILRYVEAALTSYLNHPEVRAAQPLRECNLKWVAWVTRSVSSPSSDSEAATDREDGVQLEPSHPHLTVNYFICYIRSFYPPPEWYQTGARLGVLYEAARHHPNMKIVQGYIARRSAAQQQERHVYDTLLVNPSVLNFIIPEGSKSNYLLLTHENRFLCSDKEDILVGVTLQSVTEVIQEAGLGTVIHQKLYLRDLVEAKSVISLGTSPGVLPIREIVLYKEGCDVEKTQCEAAAKAGGGVNLSLHLKMIEEDMEIINSSATTPMTSLDKEGDNRGSRKKKCQLMVIQKEVRNDYIDRLLAAYQTVAMKAYDVEQGC